MIEITATDVYGITHAIRGMRNPMESWELSDTPRPGCFSLNDWIGPKDKELMMKLAKAGPEHAKYRRMIVVYCDILAPLYWWKEFDTYKIGTVANSYSTMHKIHAHKFTKDMFSHEHFLPSSYNQNRTVMSNYQVLSEQYRQRKTHKLDEWVIDFIKWIESLPFSWIITGKDDVDEDLRPLDEADVEPVPSSDSWLEQTKENENV